MSIHDTTGRPKIAYTASSILLPRGAAWRNNSGGAILLPADDVVGPRIMQDCKIKKVSVFTQGGPGSCVLDIRKDVYANFPPTAADSICASAKPTISSGVKYEDVALTGWTTQLLTGDVLSFAIDSTSNFRYIYVQIDLEG